MLGWFFCFMFLFLFSIKHRLHHVARSIYSRNPDPLQKRERESSVYRVSMIKHGWVKSVSLCNTGQLPQHRLTRALLDGASRGQFCSNVRF